MKFFKRAFIALAAALIGLSAFTACNSDSKSSGQSVAEVTTEVVTTVVPTTTTTIPTTIAPTTIEPTTVKTTQPTTETTKVKATENEKSENDEDAEDGSQSRTSSNVDGGVMDAGNDYNGNEVKYDAQYSPDEFRHSGVISWGGYQWTYYSELVLPGNGLNIPGRHTTEDGYVCDGDGYIVLAADLSMLPRYSVVDTPFGREGKVYDTGCAYGVLDVYVGW